MAKKNYWYVLVLTNEGPKFVTGILPKKTAEWDKLKPPMEFTSKEYAQDVAIGLCANFHIAFSVCQPFALDSQPYFYKNGQFRWETPEVNLDNVVSWIYDHDTLKEDFEAKFPKIAELVKEED